MTQNQDSFCYCESNSRKDKQQKMVLMYERVSIMVQKGLFIYLTMYLIYIFLENLF